MLQVIPYGLEIMVIMGTGTALMTILGPIAVFIADKTETQVDDNALKKLKANPFAKKLYQVGRLLKRFSLV